MIEDATSSPSSGLAEAPLASDALSQSLACSDGANPSTRHTAVTGARGRHIGVSNAFGGEGPLLKYKCHFSATYETRAVSKIQIARLLY